MRPQTISLTLLKGECLAKKEIRLQYSGFVNFATKMISVASGLIFQLMIVRATTQSELDLWYNLNDVLAYFTLLAAALPFWTLRFVARDKEGAAKTGILANLMIAVVATLIYIPLVPLITSLLQISQEHVFLYFTVSIQIVEIYSLNVLTACLKARAPQTIGYGLLIAEGCKVILGYLLIVQFQQPLLGALLSLTIAFIIQMVYYLKLLETELRQQFKWQYVKEWLKGSVANIYNVVGNQLANFVFIMLFAYGGEGARGAMYGIERQVANVIAYSSFLAIALYPKLIAEKKPEDITTSLKMVLMFAIPMTTGVIVLADSYITIMKDEYREASPVLIVLAINAFVTTISTLFSSILYGVEEIDEKARISFRELVKSRLFIAFSLPYIHSVIALPAAFLVLTNYAQHQPLQAAIYVSIINTSARLAMFFILYIIVRKMVAIDIPWKSIGKYLFASVAMAASLLVIPRPTRIYLTLIATALGGIIYLVLLMAIDKETRALVYAVWKEIRFRVEGITA